MYVVNIYIYVNHFTEKIWSIIDLIPFKLACWGIELRIIRLRYQLQRLFFNVSVELY